MPKSASVSTKNITMVLIVLVLQRATSFKLNRGKFPDNFVFGAATSAYQVEGAWNNSDKSESIWDHFVHNHPKLIRGGVNGDVACDSYHHIDEDIAMLKELGVDFYRFSISWSRLLPKGYANVISQDGLNYYNNLIDTLIQNGIEPYVTMWHWDHPRNLQTLGGFTNPVMIDYFTDYANVLFDQFGDRVKTWITFNEPQIFCESYGNLQFAPADVNETGIADYLCHRTMLLAHAKTYHLYREDYRSIQDGRIGITFNGGWYQPNTTDDEAAADRVLQFKIGIYAHPIFSEEGDWPEVIKERIAVRSVTEGFPRSRLPEFTQKEIERIRGTADFFGLNHYTTSIVSERDETPAGNTSAIYDLNVNEWQSEEWGKSASSWLKVAPWGFTKILRWINKQYNYPAIIVLENGFPDSGKLVDDTRVDYYQRYLSALLDALDEGANVIGYAAWSLMDCFEWLDGYKSRFGLYYVDFDDPGRPRIPKKSANYFKQVIAARRLNNSRSKIDRKTRNNKFF